MQFILMPYGWVLHFASTSLENFRKNCPWAGYNLENYRNYNNSSSNNNDNNSEVQILFPIGTFNF